MKIKHLIMVSLILAVLTIGAVSASEDIDELAVDNLDAESLDLAVKETDSLSKVDESQNLAEPTKEIDMKVSDVPEKVKYGEKIKFNISISNEDASGTVHVYVDEPIEADREYKVNGIFEKEYSSPDNITYDFGEHKLFIEYLGNGNYSNKLLNYTFLVDDYDFAVDSTQPAIFGYDFKLNIEIPSAADGYITVTYKDKVYNYGDWLGSIIPAQELDLGVNNVTLHFEPYSLCDFKEKTVQDSFICKPEIAGPDGAYEYGDSNINITLFLPNLSQGNLSVTCNGELYKNIKLENGKAVVPFNDFSIGKYTLSATYTGKDYAVENKEFQIEIIPKIEIPKYVYSQNDNFTIVVTLPTNTSGRLIVKNDDGEFYNNDSASGIITIIAPKSEGFINFNYTCGNYTFCDDKYVAINEDDPNIDVFLYAPKNVVKGNLLYFYLNDDISKLKGTFYIYVDDVLKEKNYVDYYIDYNLYLYTDSLNMGNHTFRIEYQDDDNYYKVQPIVGVFNVDYIDMDIPEEFNSRYQNEIYIGITRYEDVTGGVTVFVDGIEYDFQFLQNENIFMHLNDLTAGTHEIEVKYDGNYPSFSKKGNMTVNYHISALMSNYHWDQEFPNSYYYEDDIVFYIYLPYDSTGNVNVKINDRNYSIEVKNDNRAHLILNDLPEGEYTAFISYKDNSRLFTDSINITFKVSGYSIKKIFPTQVNDDLIVNLNLPSNATGNLTINLDGKLVYNSQLINGKANLTFKEIAPGSHYISASYTGNDYDVMGLGHGFDVNVYPSYESTIGPGQHSVLYFELPKNSTGNITIDLGENFGKQNIAPVNGIINFTLPYASEGRHFFILNYTGDDYEINFWHIDKDGFERLDYTVDVVFECGIPYDVNYGNEIPLNLPNDANGNVSVYEDGSLLFTQKVNGSNNILSLNQLAGFHVLRVVYEDEKYGKFTDHDFNVRVVNMDIPIIISNTGDSKKSLITFELPKNANGYLFVKIDNGNSKLVPVNNGVATLIIENLSVGQHVIVANYSGDEYNFKSSANKTINVVDSVPAKIIANDLTALYTAGSRYSVTVYGTDGKLANGVQVVFKINGKQVGSVKTVNGIATYKVVQIPGTYKITAEALGKTVTKKLTVKHVLKLQKVKVKRSAKKLVIKVTLSKVNGKYLKSKKITLKFKGKRYTAKTSSKGVAKFTIKKNVLKKLKAGKKVTYQATYLKDTVKYTVKVKR
nr:Ig-like domain-containing protein [uncultured Methanobrevibacter sp.]